MAYTDKQIRNGATGDGGTQDTAQSGPSAQADISAAKAQAEAAGKANMREGNALLSGLDGHTVSFQ